MKKILLAIFIVFLMAIAACQQSVKQEQAPAKVQAAAPQPQAAAPTDPTVDAVGKDLSSTDIVENDLNSDGISDSGLSDIQNI